MVAEITAYVVMNVELGKEYEIKEELKKFGGVVEVSVVYGEFDVFAKVQVRHLRDLDKIVTAMRQVPGILKTSTLVASP
ncbi:MAG: Lrp/AsnC ligand binding domain-containing protein [Candidatus Bathyarchaeia archaeon]